MDHLGPDLDRGRSQRIEGEDAGQAHRALQRQAVGRLRVHHAPDVPPDDRQGIGAGGCVLRREHHDRPLRRPVVAGLRELLRDGPHAHRPVLGLDHDAQLVAAGAARVDGEDEVAFLPLDLVAGDHPGPFEHVSEPLRDTPEQILQDILEIATLGGPFRALLPARPVGLGLGLDLGREGVEPPGDLRVEAVEGRALTGGIEQLGESAAVAFEVRTQHRLELPDGRLAAARVEQLGNELAELALVAQEPLQRTGQPPAILSELLPQGRIEGQAGLAVSLVDLDEEPLDFLLDEVDVDGDARVPKGQEPDLEGPLDQVGSIGLLALLHHPGEFSVDQLEVLDDDPVAGDGDLCAHAAIMRRRYPPPPRPASWSSRHAAAERATGSCGNSVAW